MFLANYSDQLTDLPLPEYLARFERSNAVAGFVCIRPPQSYHLATIADDGTVTGMRAVAESDVWMNGGFLALRPEIFDYQNEGEELVEKPFNRLLEERRLFAHKYEGFWRAMDTFKDKIEFDRMWGRGETPWLVWRDGSAETRS
jgi:glucose-1-phosphate cytidylyltransferase